MKAGDRVTVSAYKADGTRYRRWRATVEMVEADRIVLVTQPGHRLSGIRETWTVEFAIRGIYWLDKWYNLLEVYLPDGTLDEIYVNVSSPAVIEGLDIRFTDYELDVSRKPPQGARIVDQAEFSEAASRYGYSDVFQRACYRIAQDALELADHWVASGMPVRDG